MVDRVLQFLIYFLDTLHKQCSFSVGKMKRLTLGIIKISELIDFVAKGSAI